MSGLDRFYPIVDSADWVRRLTGAGAKLIQLRVKDRSPDELAEEASKALAICEKAGAQLILNDYWSLAIEIGADFIHLGQEDLDDADLPAIRAQGIRIGISTHDRDELDRALALAPDYIALGPIYPTKLKAMRFGPQGLERIDEWKQEVGEIPLVAIGGLTIERGRACLDAGADTVSVVTDITLNADPEARTRAWIKATRA